MARPKLDKIITLLETGEEFQLTTAQYKMKTGADFPKCSKNYAEHESAVAKTAKKYGYIIKIVPQQIVFEKEKL